ncbi:MAG TPA: 2-aminoethylphosphonate--pyruvate transaminase [Patescibacteria group bacterium]|nr:2-aminoethylphosphonate--pyruvate transaminase [Patescibacteria group bacterium]
MHIAENKPGGPVTSSRDKLLFTPGPLTTSLSVKEAMLHDAGSWHFEFNALVASVRERLLGIAKVSPAQGWEAILLQGSGTYGVEAVFQTCVPRKGKVAVLSNGAYGNRMAQMLARAGIDHVVLRTAEDTAVDPKALETQLSTDEALTHVSMVHCETTTGILNPIEEVGAIVRRHQKVFIVDAMSSFGAIPIDLEKCRIDYLVSSPNKCLEGIPGFCFVLCRREALTNCAGQARSLSLDLVDQLKGFEKNGQFRYTPPTHAILGFDQALKEFEAEGGVKGRGARYRANHQALCRGMAELGLTPYLQASVQSFIITAFPFPTNPKFSFDSFYRSLSERGFIIYPGKLTQVNTFRIGTIGRLFPSDIQQLIYAIRAALDEMLSPAEDR